MQGTDPVVNRRRIAVDKLAVGMFVEAFDQPDPELCITTAGRLRCQADLDTLLHSSVEYVWVDLERSEQVAVESDKVPTEASALKVEIKERILKDRLLSQAKAESVLNESKRLLKKVLSDTFAGKAVELAPIEMLANELLEMMPQESEALRYMSFLRDKDAYLLEHSINVSFLLVTFGRYLNFEREKLVELAIGGILHDIGKIYVDLEVLNKPGKLTKEEFEHMKLHQTYAIAILDKIEGLSQLSRDICLMHHEKLDGKGYPYGLSGEQLPLHGRMSGIVDIFDALTATRAYKEAMSPAAAFKVLLSLTPFHLDKDLVYDFIRCVGIYPVGSLVVLSNGLVGIVWEAANRDALKPIVKCFYSLRGKYYVNVSMVDLLSSDLHIDKGITAKQLDIDPSPFY